MPQKFLLKAYERQVEARYSTHHHGPEILRYHPYDLCKGEELDVGFRVPNANLQVEDDFRSLVNCLNCWITEMLKWQAWIPILDSYDEDDRWQLRIEFVDPIAYRCLLEPSAMRDRFLRAMHFLLHHANMSVNPEYKDVLKADAQSKKALDRGDAVSCERHMSRREFEAEISVLNKGWSSAESVIERLKKIDGASVREATLDFRNNASHSIAPEFELGIAPCVVRRIKYAQTMEHQGNGTVTWNDDKTRTVVSYGFGHRDPLQHQQTFQAVRAQVKRTRDALEAYGALLKEVVGRIKAKASEKDHVNRK